MTDTDNVKENATTANPLELYALGSHIQSSIILSNPGNDTVRVRNIKIAETKLRNVAGQILKQVSFSARLRPGQVQEYPLEFELDPTTPPGSYKGKFECGEILQQPFILHILECIELSILPSRIVTHGIPGQQLSKEILISNKSNVAINLDQEMIMKLYEADGFGRILGSCLSEVTNEGFINVMDNLITKLKEGISWPMTIKFESKDLGLQADEDRKFNISLDIPTNLKPNKSYRGKISIYNCQLSVLLYCIKKTKEVS